MTQNAHDARRIANVHPSDWVNPTPADRYNLVVIGAGSAGLISAAIAAGLGAKVALVERDLMGGDCLNVGCVPSKALIRVSRMIKEARDAEAFGLEIAAGSEVDFAAAMDRMRRIRAEISEEDSAKRYRDELGVDVFIGSGRFVASDCIEVDGVKLHFAKAVIATGARAIAPPIAGLAEAGYLTNETVFDLTDRPKRFGVIGSGPIGSELAQAFNRLGSEVVVFDKAPHILPREDGDAAELIQRQLTREGVKLMLGCQVEKVERGDGPGNEKRIHTTTADGASEVTTVDAILVAVGRAPNVAGLDLETVGVEYDSHSGVCTNDFLQTTNPRIYAAGDIAMKWKFTHAADAAAKIVVQNALFLRTKKVTALVMPWCTYTDPEVAHVGLYEHEADASGVEIATFHVPLASVNRAVTDGKQDGFVKVHTKKGTDTILGATIVASGAGEMISEVTLAMTNKLGLGAILNTIHPYPTQAEALKRAAGAYTRTRATPAISKLLSRFMAFRR
jgi:pyruvate/2-oxoglutarate dehydrogenase complex dihydrolipoamide dehydrogenase (E3) component